uniref:Uncharacterized protein n=1 Tax=Arundo donax TaxID=35708 RepID=A0A0A9FHL9_ARUDO
MYPGTCKKHTQLIHNLGASAPFFRRVFVSSGLHRLESRRETRIFIIPVIALS